MISAAS